jgi:hypothetical protein
MKNVNDLFYIQQVKAGNIQAFATIVNKYRHLVLTLVCKIITNRDDAEDITQEIFIKFMEMPLEKPSSNFTENLLCRLEKEIIKEKRKKKVLTVLQWAVSIISIFYIPGLTTYLCTIFIPGFSFSFSFILAKIHIEPLILSAGFSVLLLLIADTLLRKYSLSKRNKDNTN